MAIFHISVSIYLTVELKYICLFKDLTNKSKALQENNLSSDLIKQQ